jgi:hypothetical protein
LQGYAVSEGGGGPPDVRYDHNKKHGVAGSSCPVKGEDGEVEQADGDLGEREGEDVAEQGEPPSLSGVVSVGVSK